MADTYVVYLAWPPLGLTPLERFAASYRGHPAGTDHRLVLVLKGAASADFADRSRVIAGKLDADHLRVPATGRDLATYAHVASELEAAELCLLNSSSEIVADGWLAALSHGLHQDSVGLVGATGSWESALSAAPRPLRPLLHRRYPPFPNPHIRTNAFMLARKLLLDLDWRAAGSRRRALELESGGRGLTRQVRERGLRTLVIDRGGRCYEPDQWPESQTFRSGRQEGLLVADNRTRQYDEATPARREQLAAFAWGDRAVSGRQPAAAPPT